MIDKFLKAKHWKLFLLMIGIPIIFQFIMIVSMFVNIETDNNSGSEFMFDYMSFAPILMIFFYGIFFVWFWSIGVGLQRMIPIELKLKVNRFKILLSIPTIYVLFLLGFIFSIFNFGEPNPAIIVVIVPLHLLSMFCIFYSLYFVAKTFKTAELQRKVTFGDFAGEFFLIWFFPIGIWIVQPKINKMIKEYSTRYLK